MTKRIEIDASWKEEAEKLKLMDDKLFCNAFDSYDFLVRMIEDLRANIEENGPVMEVEMSNGKTKTIANPAVNELNKTEVLAQKIRQELDLKMKEARKLAEDAEELSL